MTLKLTLAQRLPAYLMLTQKGAWGGSPDMLLAQDDVYRCLELSWFEGQKTVNITALDHEVRDFELPDSAIEMLRMLYSSQGQDRLVGQQSAQVLRQLQEAGSS